MTAEEIRELELYRGRDLGWGQATQTKILREGLAQLAEFNQTLRNLLELLEARSGVSKERAKR